MGTMTTLSGVGLILLFTVDYALSNQQSGILSDLYKKAAQENRPMILVVDSDSGKKDLDFTSRNLGYSQKKHDLFVNKQSDYKENAQKSWPMNFLQHLGQKHYHIKDKHNHAHDHSHELASQRLPSRGGSRLRSRSDRNERSYRYDRDDRRGDRDRRIRNRNNRDRHDHSREDHDRGDRYRDVHDWRDSDRNSRNRYDRDRRVRDDRDRRDRDRYDSDRRDRDRYDSDWRDRSIGDNDRSIDRTLRALIQNTLKDKEPEEKESDDPKTRALRSAVINNLLRAANDLNCEAKDECQDDCGGEKKKDACEDKCEKEFKCEEEVDKKDDCEGKDECDQEDECGGDDDCGEEDKNPSTRGIKFEDEITECKRC